MADNFQSGSLNPGSRGAQVTGSIKPLSDAERAQLDNSKSTIKKSEQQTIEVALMAAIPYIPPPKEIINEGDKESSSKINSVETKGVTLFSMGMQEVESKAIIRLLESWSEDLQKQAIDSTEAAKKKGQEQSYLKQEVIDQAEAAESDQKSPFLTEQTEKPLSAAAMIALFGYCPADGAIKPEEAENNSALITIPPAVAAAAIVIKGKRAGEMLPSFDATAGTDMMGVPSEENEVGAIIEISPIPSDMHADLSYLGAIFVTAAQYTSEAETVAKHQHYNKPQVNQFFAKRYGENLLNSVESNQFSSIVKGLLRLKSEDGKPLSEGRQNELLSMLKITLLMTGLVLAYRVEIGGNRSTMTLEELKALLQGKMTLPEGDIKGKLVKAIRGLLYEKGSNGSPVIETKRAETLLAALFEYMESNPKMEELIEPTHVCMELLRTDAVRPQEILLEA